jgi:hypothetical protein
MQFGKFEKITFWQGVTFAGQTFDPVARERSGNRQVHQYDKILKENMEATLPGLMRNVLGIHAVKTEDLPDGIQHTKERCPDVLKKITDEAGNTYVLHVEFQSKSDPAMVYRMAEYFVMLSRKYKIEVRQYVIYIGPGTPAMPTRWHCKQMLYSYELIVLAEIDYRLLLSSGNPSLKVLAILADFKGDAPAAVIDQIVKQVIGSTERELDRQRHINHLSILSQLRNLDKQITQVMESIATFYSLERDPIYKIGEKKGKKTIVKNLLRTTDFSITRIASLAEVTEEFVLEVKRSLNS